MVLGHSLLHELQEELVSSFLLPLSSFGATPKTSNMTIFGGTDLSPMPWTSLFSSVYHNMLRIESLLATPEKFS